MRETDAYVMVQSLLSASMDKTVRLWKLGSNVCRGVLPHNGYGMLLLLLFGSLVISVATTLI